MVKWRSLASTAITAIRRCVPRLCSNAGRRDLLADNGTGIPRVNNYTTYNSNYGILMLHSWAQEGYHSTNRSTEYNAVSKLERASVYSGGNNQAWVHYYAERKEGAYDEVSGLENLTGIIFNFKSEDSFQPVGQCRNLDVLVGGLSSAGEPQSKSSTSTERLRLTLEGIIYMLNV
ncbi:hypothetical protein K440DRAFT_642156 [Wilcoxina mikolae CBS 423.85]|nr:hypothetical protein K440DRAFT_642156 [Wilcoxina mikolae CBS 423.85]